MAKDPLRDAILTALKTRRLDPTTFESCMCDLLRDGFPSLVPVRGGNDAGRDGEICTVDGPAIPLICTTSKDVIRNLTGSLESYLCSGGRKGRVVLATSVFLTPRRRRNLEERARELGFELLPPIDGYAVADRLYTNEAWRRELLGLHGKPPALSAIPPRPRYAFRKLELLGREADLERLSQARGDLVLAGQPGSGKTHLLETLVTQGDALFLTSKDDEHIADALRKLSLADEPIRWIIVDDVDPDGDQLPRLVNLREQLGLRDSFSIIAVCWEHDADQVAHQLGGLPSSRVHKLELLTRKHILEIIKRVGIKGPDGLLHELVSQASNRPGLAVTLASLCRDGDWERVVLGEALEASVMPDLKRRLGPESARLLTALAIGGDRGLTLKQVGRWAGLDAATRHELSTGLAAGGLLRQTGPHPLHDAGSAKQRTVQSLSVCPRTLRWILVRDAFFNPRFPATNMDYRPFLEIAISRDDVIETILAALLRRGELAAEEVRELVHGSSSPDVWRLYATLRPEDVLAELESLRIPLCPPIDVAPEALAGAPVTAIPWLLRNAETATGPLHSNPGHPMRILKDWLVAIDGRDLSESLQRRRLAVDLAQTFLDQGGDPHVAAHAVLLSLSPSHRSMSLDPANLSAVKLRKAYIPGSFIPELRTVWKTGRPAITTLEPPTWERLSACLWSWMYPHSITTAPAIPEELVREMRELAAEMLHDLMPLASTSAGLTAGLIRLASHIKVNLPLRPDPTFEVLFPAAGTMSEQPSWNDEAAALAEDMATRDPAEVVSQLKRSVEEARKINHTSPERMTGLCEHLATAARDPGEWLQLLLDEQDSAHLIRPFLDQVVQRRPTGWEHLAARTLEAEALKRVAVMCLLQCNDLPADLLDRALEAASACPEIIDTLCLRDRIPGGTLLRLLRHPDSSVALEAAGGLWYAPPQAEIRPELRPAWEQAVLRFGEHDEHTPLDDYERGHWMRQVVRASPELARQWLKRRIKTDTIPMLDEDDSSYDQAAAALRHADREQLLDSLRPGLAAERIIARLVDRDVALYERLLARPDLRLCHLVPLNGEPDEIWQRMAVMAHDAGHSPQEIARATADDTGQLWDLDMKPAHWVRLIESFTALAGSDCWRLRAIASAGLEVSKHCRDRDRALLHEPDEL